MVPQKTAAKRKKRNQRIRELGDSKTASLIRFSATRFLFLMVLSLARHSNIEVLLGSSRTGLCEGHPLPRK
jgi:hypothetical protein